MIVRSPNPMKNLKDKIYALGVFSTSSALFASYHISKITLSNPNLNTISVERLKLGNDEYLEHLPIYSLDRPDCPSSSSSYIERRWWRDFCFQQGPKYWALIANTSRHIARPLALEILSKTHSVSDSVLYKTALACDHKTLINLAKRQGIDSEFLYEEIEIEPSADDASPRRVDLSPPPQTLASLTSSTLDVITHLTRIPQQRHEFIYTYEGLQLLTRMWFTFSSDDVIMAKLANVIRNLTLDELNHQLLVDGGFLHLLVNWTESSNTRLKVTASTALANLSKESQYSNGVYLLHPLYEEVGDRELDVIFVHGINGSAFHTWRQSDTARDHINYSWCWPLDWLAKKFGSAMRVLAVDYTSSAFSWRSRAKNQQLNIHDQAVALADALCSCEVGDPSRKVLWVAHSLGGLLVKQILVLAKENEKYKKLLHNTEGVMFLAVPHRGCPAARFSKKTSYLAHPSLHLRQIADSDQLNALNEEYLQLAAQHGITSKNFLEGLPTRLASKINIHIVPPECAELEVGENILLREDNHITICKPKDRSSPIYLSLVETVNHILHKQDSADSGESAHSSELSHLYECLHF
ncbi:SERAC1 [Bugula neritina]|uniref:Protein SERAC1 n=1 Tax=Bugula neritina TaxID=10212 RepID=A0A7J7K1U0_BUGNE|nr:SERAC1 [Bugula neritina]